MATKKKVARKLAKRTVKKRLRKKRPIKRATKARYVDIDGPTIGYHGIVLKPYEVRMGSKAIKSRAGVKRFRGKGYGWDWKVLFHPEAEKRGGKPWRAYAEPSRQPSDFVYILARGTGSTPIMALRGVSKNLAKAERQLTCGITAIKKLRMKLENAK